MRSLSRKDSMVCRLRGTAALLAVIMHIAGSVSIPPYTGVSSPLYGRRCAVPKSHLVQRLHRSVPDSSMSNGEDESRHVETSSPGPQSDSHGPQSDEKESEQPSLADPNVIAALEAPISDLSPAVQQLLEQEIENMVEEKREEEEKKEEEKEREAESQRPQEEIFGAAPAPSLSAADPVVADPVIVVPENSFLKEWIIPNLAIPALFVFIAAPLLSLATSKYTSMVARQFLELHPILEVMTDQRSRDIVVPLLYILCGYVISNTLAWAAQRKLLNSWLVDETTALFIEGCVKWGSLAIAASVIMRMLGWQSVVGLDTLLASSGVALAFALQQRLQNLGSGFMILRFRPFQVGDRIQAGPITGTVMSVGIMETLLLTDSGIRVWYPNALIKDTFLQNHTQHGMRRIEVCITVSVKANVAKTRKALEDAIEPFQDLWKEGSRGTTGLGPTPPGLPELQKPAHKPRLS
eukprot:1870556-Rhodomonas_salina.1